MSRHQANLMFDRLHITGRDSYAEATGPFPVMGPPWRRWTRDGTTILFHMVMIRPPGGYTGRHRRDHEVDEIGSVTYCPNGPGREHQVRMDGTVLQCLDPEEFYAER